MNRFEVLGSGLRSLDLENVGRARALREFVL
jgi:hypothetical protein